MAATLTPARGTATTHPPEHAPAPPRRGTQSKLPVPARPNRHATDDEILGLASPAKPNALDGQLAFDFEPTTGEGQNPADDSAASAAQGPEGEPENLRNIFDANPELRRAWQDAQSYRETFPTPEEARAATALLADLNRMDALFFSRRPEDHAELARAIANLDPASFASLAQMMNSLAAEASREGKRDATKQATETAPGAARAPLAAPKAGNETDSGHGSAESISNGSAVPGDATAAPAAASGLTAAQAEFFHATNAAAVQDVLDAIESQVERLLPEGVSKSARNRVVGEIYRELDTSLRSNRQLAQQMREAFRSGGLDEDHQRALVSLVTGRARQALPGIAKRVLNEWTSTIVAANQDRRARQRAAERRVDIAGSSGAGNDGRRSMTPRDIDYARMSDADILNL